MRHPNLGLPPLDVTAGSPAAARALRDNRERLARLALEATLRAAPHFGTRYDEIALRLFLRDFGQHIEQLARAMETAFEGYVTEYGEWLVPILRRREVPMKDFLFILAGLREAIATVLSPTDADTARVYISNWADRMRHHGRLPGDHKGNPLIRFFWKGSGVADDEII